MGILEDGVELAKRQVLAVKTNSTVVTFDNTNECSVPGFPYIFHAEGDKLLVSVDVFKSGYECRDCEGVGRIKSQCPCEATSRPGYKYAEPSSPAQTTAKCPDCEGDFVSKRVDEECKLCKGTGASLFIPDSGKVLPTTGVVVSYGDEVTNPRLKQNARILFGAYSGTMIPTKAPGIVFKVIREHEVLCTIRGGENLAAFDFINVDREL